jgi:hypothetical protein
MATAPDTTPDDVTAPGPVTERTDGRVLTDDDIPSGLNGPFFQEIGQRKLDGRDAKCLVTAKDGQTGVGKSNACDFLAYVTDTTDEGFTTEKATIEPMRFLELYGILEPGSAAVMEEGEQFDSRRAMTNENVEATHKWQKARVREIVAFVNLPDPTMIDGRFERLCDYWINVERRGLARIYKKGIHPTKRVIYYETLQTLEWPNMDGSVTFRHMDDMKASLLDGELNNDSLIRESEADERVRKAEKQAAQAKRDELLTAVYKETDLTAGDVAALSAVDVKGSRIRQIASNTS